MTMFNNIYKNKKVLVTGDTGFKGSWLSIWLKILGADLVGVALPPKTPKDNYIICGLADKIYHMDQDIRDYEKILGIFEKHKPEIVFHLAAQPLVLESYQKPRETYSTNLMGTVNILEAIRHTNSVKAGIIVTSDKCYKNQESLKAYNENDTLGGKDPYSASKAICEIAVSSYIESFFNEKATANIATARAGNVIGGGDWAENRIIPDCIKALEKNEAIVIRNAMAIRPWQHVLESLSGYLKLGELLYTYNKEFVGAWNFGPHLNSTVTVMELVDEFVKQWGNGSISYNSNNKGKVETSLLQLDISKAINKLNWKPKLNFEETIKYTIEEYKIDQMTQEEIYKQRIEHIKKYMGK